MAADTRGTPPGAASRSPLPERRPHRTPMPPASPLHQILGLIAWLALCAAAGAVGAIASSDAPAFYAELARPGWAPPASAFGPVWSLLYTLMGVAAWLVWRRHGWRQAGPALLLFVVQLALNALWSWLFFAWRLGGAALADIVLLVLLIAATSVAFWPLQRAASVLLWPYLAWVGFATALNYTLWRMNPALLG
ncbi:TspO/MBR family protein [Aquincola sp. MAHUQ-54]|uniref:TspO/MBR family protein n=2 Tax=Sphaerotilaceae TaxID=2975441 RepID=A0AAW9QDG6_9BURK